MRRTASGWTAFVRWWSEHFVCFTKLRTHTHTSALTHTVAANKRAAAERVVRLTRTHTRYYAINPRPVAFDMLAYALRRFRRFRRVVVRRR